jgi:hypothetical protein
MKEGALEASIGARRSAFPVTWSTIMATRIASSAMRDHLRRRRSHLRRRGSHLRRREIISGDADRIFGDPNHGSGEPPSFSVNLDDISDEPRCRPRRREMILGDADRIFGDAR